MRIRFHDLDIEPAEAGFVLSFTFFGATTSLPGRETLEDSIQTWLEDSEVTPRLMMQLEELQELCSELEWDEARIEDAFPADAGGN